MQVPCSGCGQITDHSNMSFGYIFCDDCADYMEMMYNNGSDNDGPVILDSYGGYLHEEEGHEEDDQMFDEYLDMFEDEEGYDWDDEDNYDPSGH